jgi:hypothetical protein
MADLPEIKPIKTTERFFVELRPERATPDAEVGYEWRRVLALGERLTASIRGLSATEQRQLRKVEDSLDRIEAILALGLCELYYQRARIDADELPLSHRATLGSLIFQMSASGLDPFGEAPAASQP